MMTIILKEARPVELTKDSDVLIMNKVQPHGFESLIKQVRPLRKGLPNFRKGEDR